MPDSRGQMTDRNGNPDALAHGERADPGPDAPAIDVAVPQDREAVVALFAEDLADLRLPVDLEALRNVFAALVADPRAVLLVVREAPAADAGSALQATDAAANPAHGEAIGVLVASRVPSVKFSGWSMWIEELYVGRRGRQRGLGRALVLRLLEVARREGVKGIDLEAYHGNAPAALLYRSLGFRRLGRERFYYRLEWEQDLEAEP